MNWQPIETAPKDGTKVLVKVQYSEIPSIAFFERGRWEISHYHLRVVGGCGYCGGDIENEQDLIFTQWAPIPGHDLSSVVVVDRKAMEGVKDALGRILVRADSGDPIYPHSVLIRLAREALASLNAGGEG